MILFIVILILSIGGICFYLANRNPYSAIEGTYTTETANTITINKEGKLRVTNDVMGQKNMHGLVGVTFEEYQLKVGDDGKYTGDDLTISKTSTGIEIEDEEGVKTEYKRYKKE